MANAIDAAPLSPTQDINICCLKGILNQLKILNVAIGLTINIINKDINIPSINTSNILDG